MEGDKLSGQGCSSFIFDQKEGNLMSLNKSVILAAAATLAVSTGSFAGGGAGGAGGAGGFRYFAAAGCTPGAPALPLNGPAALPVSVACYPIAVGAGGAAQNTGAVSSFSTIPSCITSYIITTTSTTSGGNG
jgi:hypothetical protein